MRARARHSSPEFIPRKTEGADTRAGVSADQIAAKEFAQQTQMASLELCVDNPVLLGQCEAGYTCAYMNTLCWSTPTTPIPMENRPRAVFERLFGDNDSTDPAVRLRQIQTDRSILDSVTEKVTASYDADSVQPTAPSSPSISTPFAMWSGASRRPRNSPPGNCRRSNVLRMCRPGSTSTRS